MTDTASHKKFALITGGSDGIGLGFAKMLRCHGYTVGLVARNKEKLERARAELLHNESGDGDVLVFSADVTDEQSLKELREAVARTTPHIDMLVQSAGTFKWDAELRGLNLQLLNATSKEMVLRECAPLLQSGATVVHVSSQAAQFSADDPRRQGELAYVRSMEAVDTFSTAFAQAHPELKVFIAHPGLLKGNIARESFSDRPGFEDIDFENLPEPETVARDLEAHLFAELEKKLKI